MKVEMRRVGDETHVIFWCAGCDTHHSVPVTGPRAWKWNESLDALTITPSIRVLYERKKNCCHSNVTDGKITYHNDTTHALRGQTVELEELP